jgi:hypothetical protein
LADVATFPERSTATQSEVDAHETAVKGPTIFRCADFQVRGPPVGKVEVTTFRASSTATHWDSEGQETPVSAFHPTGFLDTHALEPPLGSIELMASPFSLTARQRDADGHEIPSRDPGAVLGIFATFHAAVPALG